MFDFFPDQPSYEYPPLVNVVYALVWAFLLSSVVAITHRLTSIGENYSNHFFQAMVLGGIITTMVMIAIGDSLARGLGVFGAMAIIRFQARIDNPRNVLFLFAALSTGISIGVYGYSTAFAGTAVFCLIAVLLHFTRFRGYNQNSMLYFTLIDASKSILILELMKKYCHETTLINISINKSNETCYEYSISMHDCAEKEILLQEINKLEGVKQLSITTTNTNS